LSMQDGAAWLTQSAWNEIAAAFHSSALVHCSDGYVAAQASVVDIIRELGAAATQEGAPAVIDAKKALRASVIEEMERANIACAPVLRVTEVAAHAQTSERQLIVMGRALDGTEWPLLTCPIRLSATPPVVKRAIGALGADNDAVFKTWLSNGEPPPISASQQTG